MKPNEGQRAKVGQKTILSERSISTKEHNTDEREPKSRSKPNVRREPLRTSKPENAREPKSLRKLNIEGEP